MCTCLSINEGKCIQCMINIIKLIHVCTVFLIVISDIIESLCLLQQMCRVNGKLNVICQVLVALCETQSKLN